jgi:hypothetical protein
MDSRRIDAFISEAQEAYAETGLWSESCNGTARDMHDCQGEDCDSSLETIGFGLSDIDADSWMQMQADVKDFIEGCLSERPDCFDGMDAERVGHDFWLTRNGHGVGFWDRGLGELGDWLTTMSKPYGESTLYVGDDGNVYYMG